MQQCNLEVAFNGKSGFTQKTDNVHTLQVVLRIEPATALGKLARHENASVIVILNRSHRYATELCNFSRRVF